MSKQQHRWDKLKINQAETEGAKKITKKCRESHRNGIPTFLFSTLNIFAVFRVVGRNEEKGKIDSMDARRSWWLSYGAHRQAATLISFSVIFVKFRSKRKLDRKCRTMSGTEIELDGMESSRKMQKKKKMNSIEKYRIDWKIVSCCANKAGRYALPTKTFRSIFKKFSHVNWTKRKLTWLSCNWNEPSHVCAHGFKHKHFT